MKDYYNTLGVQQNATIEQIKERYHQLAKIYHPDKQNGNESAFKKINEAYSILSNTNKRKEYDALYQNTSSTQKKQNPNTTPKTTNNSLSEFAQQYAIHVIIFLIVFTIILPPIGTLLLCAWLLYTKLWKIILKYIIYAICIGIFLWYIFSPQFGLDFWGNNIKEEPLQKQQTLTQEQRNKLRDAGYSETKINVFEAMKASKEQEIKDIEYNNYNNICKNKDPNSEYYGYLIGIGNPACSCISGWSRLNTNLCVNKPSTL